MDAFTLLKADHQKVAELFERLEAASGKRKLAIFDQIQTELDLHAHIEEKIFYPALEKPEETHDLTLEAYEEHAMVKKLLRELSGDRTADEDWQAKAKVLQENVEHHVDEEENELFDKAGDALSEEEIEELGERMEAEKVRVQGGTARRTSARKSGAKKSASTKKGGKKQSGSKGSKKSSKKAGKSSKSSKSSGSKKGSRSKKSAKKGRR
jgi:hemerythrin-like domain-containing protein